MHGGRERKAMKECYPDRSRTARDILSHISGRPEGQDTFDNIVTWWLKGQESEEHRTLVKEVLDDLVTQGRMKRIQREGQVPYYRVHSDHSK